MSDTAISRVHVRFCIYQTQNLPEVPFEIPRRCEEGAEGTRHRMDALENNRKKYLLMRSIWLCAHIYVQLIWSKQSTQKNKVEEIKGEFGTIK